MFENKGRVSEILENDKKLKAAFEIPVEHVLVISGQMQHWRMTSTVLPCQTSFMECFYKSIELLFLKKNFIADV